MRSLFFAMAFICMISASTAESTKGRIVMVTASWCAPCAVQKRIIKKMQDEGKLDDVEVRYVTDDPSFPAKYIPTLYINKQKPLVGVQQPDTILKTLEKK